MQGFAGAMTTVIVGETRVHLKTVEPQRRRDHGEHGAKIINQALRAKIRRVSGENR
jgi:hypothetical protein